MVNTVPAIAVVNAKVDSSGRPPIPSYDGYIANL